MPYTIVINTTFMVIAWKLFYRCISLMLLITVSEPPAAIMEPTLVSETTQLAPTPSPTEIPGEFKHSPGD